MNYLTILALVLSSSVLASIVTTFITFWLQRSYRKAEITRMDAESTRMKMEAEKLKAEAAVLYQQHYIAGLPIHEQNDRRIREREEARKQAREARKAAKKEDSI